MNLTEEASQALDNLKALLPDVDEDFIVETSLKLTAALYQKSAEGALIHIQYANGKAEELRFKVKKTKPAKGKTT